MEENKKVEKDFYEMKRIDEKKKVDILVKEEEREDVGREKDKERREIYMSKMGKFKNIYKVRGLKNEDIQKELGNIKKKKEIVDEKIINEIKIGDVEFIVRKERGINERERRNYKEIGRRVIYVEEDVKIIRKKYEKIEEKVSLIDEVEDNEINMKENIFESLREEYKGFDKWWKEKWVKKRRI